MNLRFENDVKMYGTETSSTAMSNNVSFENDVKMYGTETRIGGVCVLNCLRMM